ncbi:MAG: hypothetical protein K6U08_02395, partial [Firmicutes bacterium]|nr:hypothetical protein [Bacillota bacterium]
AQRTVLLLRELEGLSYEEIGAVMDMSLGAVKACLHRARRRFREEYAREPSADGEADVTGTGGERP